MATGRPSGSWDYYRDQPLAATKAQTEARFADFGRKIRGNMSGSEIREVYVVMCGDVIDGVYTDIQRARVACEEIIRRALEDQLAYARESRFRNYAVIMRPLV